MNGKAEKEADCDLDAMPTGPVLVPHGSGDLLVLGGGTLRAWRDTEIQRLERELAAIMAANADLRQQVEDRAAIMAADADLRQQVEDRAAIMAANADLRQQVEVLSKELRAMTESRSWRVTRPLRWLGRLLWRRQGQQ